ncbi:acyl-ACP--UDP-N-acetylglucosamine O-acyltransferase [Porticoccaceae bacterium]|jgi:UDP-N-acetylglucosamine acyltransferase|nr:acyl-ACP--UDP-N-acetylglucosamine O-acyltransferase [Porticoccaceae bacterium]MBT7258493.1 acyl-ACP--UDP-N-acetylglucosamine O-acyltransferase [Porticoccaceae bacterium]MBT7904319.1 acyl-ACP--UDP-N-acetylglucosamine O-acyltransferase [Porticoccaceae bacterium]MDA7816074.1 acyl-ACP--UDP-N-acetylglucosamine O-acyltransferase [Porticoccaceae bacterium]MDA8735592.1 acyl-ACP--UDP-N-acetylglucosamine O-acyltransferase [Porticoccaceae bacterium]
MIDSSAIVDPSAVLGENVSIGPWTIIGPNVEIGDGCEIASHVVIKGPTVIGRNNKIFQFSTLGEDTPDLKYKGEPTRLIIGDNNVIREGVTIHRGTVQDKSETRIGNHNLLMAYVHVGHDSVVGDHVIMVNNASISGHVHVGDWTILSGYCLVHQFVNIGPHCFIGPAAFIYHDVPAFVTAFGSPAEPRTINREGLKRRGYSADQIALANKAYKLLYRRGLQLDEALKAIADLGDDEVVAMLLSSLENSSRGIIR